MKKTLKLSLYISLLIAPIVSIANNDDVKHYPYVHVFNSASDMTVTGIVHYTSPTCSNDTFTLAPRTAWTADSRGICLVTGIEATDLRSGQSGTPYASSGTSYSQFLVYKDEGGKSSVTRTTD
jgi:hypothetical protein